MKCTDKIKLFLVCFISVGLLSACGNNPSVTDYETEHYQTSLYEGNLLSSDLCVSNEDVMIDGYNPDTTLHAAALFDLNEQKVEFAYKLHERIYPASTTKILTAYIALNRSQLTDVVTISESAAASSFGIDDQVCGLQAGDQITMEALLYGLLLHSGNDNAVAIAEYIGGSVEGFAEIMNETAKAMYATNTHFTSPNGLHREDHYTTAYDLYLMFNQCIKNNDFVNIIASSSYTANITGADGSVRQITWYPTSYYSKGLAAYPEGATIIGGKTGYTGEAGNCLILLDKDFSENPYISIVMGAETKPQLYDDMTALINQIPNTNE